MVLDWSPVPGAESYEVQVATNTDFSRNVLESTADRHPRAPVLPADHLRQRQYFWRVRPSTRPDQATPWSDARYSFTRTWPHAPTAVYPAPPAPRRPRTALLPVDPVPHASEYEFQIGTEPNFTVGTFDSCRSGGHDVHPRHVRHQHHRPAPLHVRANEDCTPQAGEINYWRVRALDRPFTKAGDNPGVQGLFSETQAFLYHPLSVTDMAPATARRSTSRR